MFSVKFLIGVFVFLANRLLARANSMDKNIEVTNKTIEALLEKVSAHEAEKAQAEKIIKNLNKLLGQ